MIQDKELIKLIFGFKIKYLRQEKNLSYQQLSELTGSSLSYLHEIENGKKYPSTKKIIALANALGVEYDDLVSTKKAPKKMKPVIDLLNSDFFNLFPIDFFGIEMNRLLELFSKTPDKLNAFLGTIFKITRNYHVREENFYQAALRSYQDLHNNYFIELEQATKRFKTENDIKGTLPYTAGFLEKVLKDRFEITIDRTKLATHESLNIVRSFFDRDENKLYLNKWLDTAQENFILGREIAFQYLGLKERSYETRILKMDNFEMLLNNFKASYFSAALLMDEEEMAQDIQNILEKNEWDATAFLGLLSKYNVTPEMLLQRMTNIFPKMGIHDLFFIRIYGSAALKRFNMTKELHLSQLHNPHASELNENYCQRWVSISILKKLRAIIPATKTPIADAQISKYWESPNEYLCLSIAKPLKSNPKASISVTIGLLVNEELRKRVNFLNQAALKKLDVNTTCERCSIPDCLERKTPPIVLEKRNEVKEVFNQLNRLKSIE